MFLSLLEGCQLSPSLKCHLTQDLATYQKHCLPVHKLFAASNHLIDMSLPDVIINTYLI